MPALGLLPLDSLLPSWWLAAYLAGLALFPLGVLLILAIRLAGKRLRFPEWVPLDAARIPPELKRQAQPWIGRMAYLGYQVVDSRRRKEDTDPEVVTWHLAHATDRTVAVFRGALPASGGAFSGSLTLFSFLADGRVIVTADRPMSPRSPAHWSVLQQRFPTIEGQVQGHRSRVAALAGDAAEMLPAPGVLALRLAEEERALFDALLASGDFTTSGEDTLKVSFPRLPVLACRRFAALLSGSGMPSGRRKDVASVARDNTPGGDDLVADGPTMRVSLEQLVERDLRRYRKHADEPPGKMYFLYRLAYLATALIFFTLTFGRESPLATVLMLLSIIAVHEFGHWLAMKAFGYKGMGRFFVPFLGPIDRGRKLHAPAFQQFVVILAGPVPGLLTGLGILAAGVFLPDLPMGLLDFGGLAVVLNAFHLLPFLPLDGGKVVDLLLFRDLPMIRPVFTVISATLTFLASLVMKSRPVRFLAIGMFAGLVWDIKMIKVVRGGRRLGWAGTIDDEDEALRQIFRGVRGENNEAFFRSHDWLRQIDVLLAEVLRKRPGFFTRLFGGAVYWAVCGLPILLVLGMFALMIVGNIGSLGRSIADSAEFREAFPMEKRSITEPQYADLDALRGLSSEAMDHALEVPEPDELRALASESTPRLGPVLDKLDWKVAGIALHGGDITTPELSLWLEIQCGRLEVAARDGKDVEAVRRAEVLLYAFGALEPVQTFDDRRVLWDAELRTLASVEILAASGRLDKVTLKRIEARVSALNKAALPEVDNFLLVGGWADLQATKMFGAGGEDHEDPGRGAVGDARFWRHVYPQLRQLSENGFSHDSGTLATVGLARHWTKSRRVGEIPASLEEPVVAAPGEAEFIVSFCESHRKIRWRRLTTLSALGMEMFRQNSGKLPDLWKHSVPGGAFLELVDRDRPCLHLVDARDAGQRELPGWLGRADPSPEPLGYLCPLYGGN